MVLSRFWIFALSIVAMAAIGAALLAQGMVNRQTVANLENGLRRDRLEVEQTLKLDARARIDAIAPLAAHPDVRTALKSASNRRSDEELRALNTTLKPKLQDLNRQLLGMSADILFAVDANGVIVAQLGPNEARFGGGLATFPLVERALAGHVRDDVWAYDGSVYRMAARPVIDSGGYVGAIVHGKKLDEGLATLLSRRVNGASIAFFRREAIVGSFTPTDVPGAPTQAELGAVLATALTNPELVAGNVTAPLDVAGRGRAVFSLVTGAGADAQIGYVIARPLTLLASPSELFNSATTEDFAALPKGALGGAAFGLFVLGMLFFWLEKDRPFSRLKKRAKELGERKIDRMPIADFSGNYRRIAESVNLAMDKAVEHASENSPKKKANLDEILGPASGGQPQAFFGFSGQSGGGSASDIPDIPPAPAASAPRGAPAMPARAQPPAAAPMLAPPAAAPMMAPPAAASMMASPAPAAPVAPPRPAAAAPAPPARPAAGGPPAPPVRSPAAPPPRPQAFGTATLAGMPPEPGIGGGPVQPRTYLPPSPAAGAYDDDQEEGATMIARVPEALLNASATGQMGAVSQGAADEELHFRQVFDDFVATKKQCGEPTAGFTYDKFVQTLRKNKEQIVMRHGAKGVRFTVYVKDGKAALKATPIKD